MNNILITSAGRRVSLVRAFKKELTKYFKGSKVYTCDLNPDLSAACAVSDGAYKVPAVSEPGYACKLLELCQRLNVKLIVPTIDTELLNLSSNTDFLIKNGVLPVVSEYEIVSICRNKRRTNKFFDSIGFPRCAEIDPFDPVFPIFAKPIDGSSSIGILKINDSSELTQHILKDENLVFLEFIDLKKHTEYTIDLYFDKKNILKCAVPRERIEVRAGEVSKSVTRRDEIYEVICRSFGKTAGFRGCITLQVFRNNKTKRIIGSEINPRFGGGYPLSYQAGANYPEMIIREYLLNEELPFMDHWKPDLLMLRYDDEVLIDDYKG